MGWIPSTHSDWDEFLRNLDEVEILVYQLRNFTRRMELPDGVPPSVVCRQIESVCNALEQMSTELQRADKEIEKQPDAPVHPTVAGVAYEDRAWRASALPSLFDNKDSQ